VTEPLEDKELPGKRKPGRNDKNLGDDLDLPGSELDDSDEAIGKEDEEITITDSAAMITKTWKKTKNSRSGRWDFYNLFLAVKNIPMKNDIIYPVLALFTGALIPIQASTNSIFSKSIGNPLITGLMVFIVGLVGMIIFIALSGTTFPVRHQLVSAPLYSDLGGIIIATYVVIITFLVPRIGVGTAIGLIVTGQIICAVIIDHFGLFSVPVHSISITRVAGVLLMIAGIYLVMKK